MQLDALIRFYNEFSPASIDRFEEFYALDARFKDPFNEVRGIPAIQRIFTHMFTQVADPRFVVTEKIVDGNVAVLLWEFRFRGKQWGRDQVQVIRGVSHLKFDRAGKVCEHRDYWDAAEELYEKLPVVGALIRFLRRQISA